MNLTASPYIVPLGQVGISDLDFALVAHLYDERNPAVKRMIGILMDAPKSMA